MLFAESLAAAGPALTQRRRWIRFGALGLACNRSMLHVHQRR